MNIFKELFNVIESRKESSAQKSYTRYLFQEGIDKICKKVGEESAETIIAAKNGDKIELSNEICDLIFHIFVLASNEGIEFCDIEDELQRRAGKIGNLKDIKKVDKNT